MYKIFLFILSIILIKGCNSTKQDKNLTLAITNNLLNEIEGVLEKSKSFSVNYHKQIISLTKDQETILLNSQIVKDTKEKTIEEIKYIVKSNLSDSEKVNFLECINQETNINCDRIIGKVMKPVSLEIKKLNLKMIAAISECILEHNWIDENVTQEQCMEVKEGVFFSLVGFDTLFIDRNKEKQTEVFNKTRNKFNIRWNDYCSYTLIQEYTEMISEVEIIQVSSDKYIYTKEEKHEIGVPGKIIGVIYKYN